MNRNLWFRGSFVVLLVGLLTVSPVAAFAGSTSSGSWTFTDGPITCKFAGIHSAAGGTPYAKTNDTNAGCSNLKVRLKYRRLDGSTWTTSWKEAGGDSVTVWAAQSGTAVASQHEAENGWRGIWSGVKQPHAW